MKKKNIGSTLDSWLREEGLLGKAKASAAQRGVEREDIRINAAADELNSEVADVLKHQILGE